LQEPQVVVSRPQVAIMVLVVVLVVCVAQSQVQAAVDR
jgi:hypothetical protein